MSLPREVIPGRAYMITRRCTQRQLLLRPDETTNNAFVYCLAEAAARHGIQVLFTVAMSNHHHTGIYDPLGTYPAFIEHFHKLFAKCQNALRGRWENFWSSEQTSVVLLTDANDIVEKMVYALTNPIKDGLVEAAHHWPGVTSVISLRGRTLSARRPHHFFREAGPMPENVELAFARPPGFEHLATGEFEDIVAARIKDAEEKWKAERMRAGARVLGRRGVLAQDWRDRPNNREPRRNLHPRVAARDRWSRMGALAQTRNFREAYRCARAALLAGVRDAIFPAGTYWLRRFANVHCGPFPAGAE